MLKTKPRTGAFDYMIEPPPPPRGQPPVHVTVNLMPVERAPSRRRITPGVILFWVIIAAIWILMPRAKADTVYTTGSVTYYTYTTPDGKTHQCRSWRETWLVRTECDARPN